MKNIESISDLTPDERNANRGTQRGLGMLGNSLQKLGAGRSIVCDRNGKVIGGNKTLERAFELGFEIEPIRTNGEKLVVVIREDLDLESDPRARELAYADNRVGEVSLDWDPATLAEDWQENPDLDLDWLWSDEEFQELADFASLDRNPEEDDEATSDLINKADQGEIESRVKLGEIWACGDHRVACCDSTVEANIRRLVGDRYIGFVVADPPYGIDIVSTNVSVGGGEANDIPFGGVKGYVGGGQRRKDKTGAYTIEELNDKRTKRLGSIGGSKPFGSKDIRGSDGASNMIPVGKYAPIIGDSTIDTAVNSATLTLALFPKAIHVWWGGNYYAQCLPNSSCWVVWDKQNGETNFADAELAWTNSKTAVRIFRHMWNGLMKESERGQRRVHPTQKPIALFEWLYTKYGKPNDLIFDPFLGSGPSLIAAQQMGDRAVYGCELSEDYAEIVLRRFSNLTGQTPELVGRID